MFVLIGGSKRNGVVIEYKISNDIKQILVSQVFKTGFAYVTRFVSCG